MNGVYLSRQQANVLADIPVTLGVKVGTLNITAGELIDLFPGQTFEFEFDPLATLKLCLGDEEVAEARFILQGTELALEITRIGNNTGFVGNSLSNSNDNTLERIESEQNEEEIQSEVKEEYVHSTSN
jgi:hypothetical protein